MRLPSLHRPSLLLCHWVVWICVSAYSGWTNYLVQRAHAPYWSPIVLQEGERAVISFDSVYGQDVRLTMHFLQPVPRMRSATESLGGGTYKQDEARGTLTYLQPGEPVLVDVSLNGQSPIRMEAMPAAIWARDYVGRRLTTNLSIAPGTWRWPAPASIALKASAGPNSLSIAVVDAGPSLKGMRTEIWVDPPLTLQETQPPYYHLIWAQLWAPLAAVACAVWGGALASATAWRGWRKRRSAKEH